MTTGDALLATILTNPADDTARLVYADWLTENGQPERGEFIRVQIAIAQEESEGRSARLVLKARQQELLPTVARGFLGGILGWHTHCRVINHNAVQYDSAPGNANPQTGSIGVVPARGFIDTITDIFAADWLRFGDAIRQQHPVRRVKLTTRPDILPVMNGPVIAGWRFAGRELLHEAKPTLTMLETEWPGVTFELPPVETRTYSAGEFIFDCDPLPVAAVYGDPVVLDGHYRARLANDSDPANRIIGRATEPRSLGATQLRFVLVPGATVTIEHDPSRSM